MPGGGNDLRGMCGHVNPLNLRLMTYTRYGAMVGCLSCGNSFFVDLRKDANKPAPHASRQNAQ
jgi:hypothetical protein